MPEQHGNAKQIADALRRQPVLLCVVLQELREEKVVGAWLGAASTHVGRHHPWTGIPAAEVWYDQWGDSHLWRWAIKVGDVAHGSSPTKEQAQAEVVALLVKRGYVLTEWTTLR